MNAPKVDTSRWTELQFEVRDKSIEVFNKENAINKEARANAIAIVEEAQEKYNEIMSKENPEYTAVKEKVTSILKDVPTFADKAESLAGLDAVSLKSTIS